MYEMVYTDNDDLTLIIFDEGTAEQSSTSYSSTTATKALDGNGSTHSETGGGIGEYW